MLAGEIPRFADVAREIVEVFPFAAPQEFPLPFPDRTLGAPAPVNGLVRWCVESTGEMRDEIDPVEVARFRLDSGKGRCGRGHVEGSDGVFVGLSARNRPGPGDQKRHPNPALAEHSLFPIERLIERTVPPARISPERRIDFVDLERSPVIADEKEDRLLRKPVFLQGPGDESDSVIDCRDHSESGPATLWHLPGKAVFVGRRGVERSVWSPVGEVKEEGFVPIPLDDRGRRLRTPVDVIFRGWQVPHRHVLPVEGDVRGERALRILREDVFETMARDRRGGSEVPLPELGGVVSDFLQPGRDRRLFVEPVEIGAVRIEIETALEFPDEQAAA